MIKLAVQDYCQDCTAFEPISCERVDLDEDGNEIRVFEVRCSRWELCANVARRSKRMSMSAHVPHMATINGLHVEVR